MYSHFVKDLVCPKTRLPFEIINEQTDGDQVAAGKLVSKQTTYEIRDGVPHLVQEELEAGENQVQDVFSKYWATHDSNFKNEGKKDWYLEALKKLFLVDGDDDKALGDFLRTKKCILDAGCGSSWVARYFRSNDEQKWFNVDFGESVFGAQRELKKHANNFVARASVFSLPFHKNYFDLIFSHGVLHHTPKPKEAFLNLVQHLAPGGDICIGMIRKQVPMRDFADTYIRKRTTAMSFEKNLAFAKSLAVLAKEIQDTGVEIDVPAGLDILGIGAGKYKLHDLIHTHILKCFHSPHLSEAENVMQNIDWYTVKYAWPHTEEELISWYEEAGLNNIQLWQPRTPKDKHEMIRIKGTK